MKKTIFISVIILTSFCISAPAFADSPLDNVVIIDNGSSFLSNIENIVASTGIYDYSTIDLAELKTNGIPSGTEIVIISGGLDFTSYIDYSDLSNITLNADIIQNLQNFDGGIVAICGGADIISENIHTTYYGYNVEVTMAGLVPVDSETYTTWLSSGQNPDISFTDHLVSGDYAGQIATDLYYGGPVPTNYTVSDLEIIANYTEDLASPSYSSAGKPAIFAYNNTIYSAVHPEANSSYYNLLVDMLAYANGTLESEESAPVDADGDGYTAEVDCNDNDASVYEDQTYYLDYDADGLGDPVNSSSVCSSTPPTGYVTNSRDTNDNIPNAGVEISRDGVDNDGDGAVDEFNTLTENGAHPYYSTLDPLTSGYGTNIIRVIGRPNGKILVVYADNSIYEYTIFSSSYRCRVRTMSNLGYILVMCGSSRVIVNGYTGSLL